MSSSLNRRRFLESSGVASLGFIGGVLWSGNANLPGSSLLGSADAQTDLEIDFEARLKALGLTLPKTTPPTNTFVPTVLVGELLFVAGHGPKGVDGKTIVGKVGHDMDLAQGKQAARQVGLTLLSVVRESLGSLNRVVRVVKTLGMVNCTPDFTQQPSVVNGCSDLMVEVFGPERGKGARSAVGMVSLPGGIPVEIEMVFQVRS